MINNIKYKAFEGAVVNQTIPLYIGLKLKSRLHSAFHFKSYEKDFPVIIGPTRIKYKQITCFLEEGGWGLRNTETLL